MPDLKVDPEVYNWLEWFYTHADFGPADDDVREILKEEYRQETGKEIPEGYE